MSMNPKSDSTVNKDKNLILVSGNSDLFNEGPMSTLFLRNSSYNAQEFRRNSSFRDLLPNFHQQNRIKEEHPRRQEQLSDSQRYAQQCLEYQKYLFDDKIRLIIHRMAILAYHNFKDKAQNPFLTFFIERFLSTLAKKLLLNRFQLLFLEYVFEELKWKYDTEIISTCASEFKSFMHIPQSQSPNGLVKNLQAFLLFCAYYSKKSLNDITNEGIYNFFLKTISNRFKQRYQQWSQKSGVARIKINPKVLNTIFRKLTSFQQKQKQYLDNYNLLVEQILQISPAYNADKDGKSKKKRKKNQEEDVQREQESNNIQSVQQINTLPPEQSQQFPSLGIRKKPTSYRDNLNGLDPVDYYKRNMS